MGDARTLLIFFAILAVVAIVLMIAFTAIVFGIIFLIRRSIEQRELAAGETTAAAKTKPARVSRFPWPLLLMAGPVLGLVIGAVLSLMGIPILRGLPLMLPSLLGGVVGGLGSLVVAGVIRVLRIGLR